jgi:hypothetical protein
MSTNAMIEAARQNPAQAREAQEHLQAILTRSTTDAEFRKLLLTDSRAALSQHFGREVPESNIVFVENQADATVVLPNVVDANAELSDAELETVAGGILPLIAAVLTCMVMGATLD